MCETLRTAAVVHFQKHTVSTTHTAEGWWWPPCGTVLIPPHHVASSSDSQNGGFSFEFTPRGASNGPSRLFEITLSVHCNRLLQGWPDFSKQQGYQITLYLISDVFFLHDTEKNEIKISACLHFQRLKHLTDFQEILV